jgi:VCBS repeat-containing protein
LTYAVVTAPTKGVLSGTVPNLTYTPNANGSGSDSFTFKVNDGTLDSAVATVAIAITAVNDAPVATAQTVTTDEDVPRAITLAGTDVEGSTLTYAVVSAPTKGVLSGTVPNLTYTPNANGSGSDSFTFKVNDGTLDSAVATVAITISAVNDAPVATAQTVSTDEDVPKAITLAGTDVEGSTLTYAVVTAPTKGVLSGTAPNLTYTPNANVNGADSFTFKVNDGTLDSAVATVAITISAVNDAPVFPVISDWRVKEGQLLEFRLAATDLDNPIDSLAFRIVSGPAGTSVVADRFSWTPSESQGGIRHVIRLAVSDGSSSTTNEFGITVSEENTPPRWNDIAPVTISENLPFELTLRAIDTDEPIQRLRYMLLDGPDGASLSEEGRFIWSPTERQGPATRTVRVAVTDGETEASASFTITVEESNQTPAFVGLEDVTLVGGVPYTQFLLGSDPDIPVQPLQFRWIEGPVGSGVTNGIFFWTPGTVSSEVIQTAALAVSDGLVSVTNRFNLRVKPSGGGPSFVGLANAVIPEQVPYRQVLKATHPQLPEAALLMRLVSGPSGAVLQGNALVWTPVEEQGPGTYPVRVSVSDGVNAVTNGFVLVVQEVNAPPVFAVPTNAVIPELVAYTQVLRYSDADLPAQSLNPRLVSGPVGARIVGDTFSWTPTEAQGPGTNDILVAVSDGIESVTNAFTVVVKEVPTAPSLALMVDREVPESADFTWAIPGVDSDLPAQVLTYRMLEGPVGAVLSNGVFAWTPSETDGGSQAVLSVAVSDGNTSVTNRVTLTVLEVNRAPVPAPMGTRRVSEGNQLAFTVLSTDTDLPVQRLLYTAVSAPAGMTVSSNGVVSWRPTEAQGPSTNVVLVRVTDDGKPALSATNSIEVVVREVNLAPVLGGISNRTVKLPGGVALSLKATDADLPVQALTFGLVAGPTGMTVGNDGTLRWTPTESQARSTNRVTVSASDGTAKVETSFEVVVEASPRLALRVEGSTVNLQVAGPPGATCRLEQADTVGGPWTAVPGVNDIVTGGFNTPQPVSLPGPMSPGRLYRLRVL